MVGSNSMYSGYSIVGMKLPDGRVKVIKSPSGSVGDVITESVFMEKYVHINEDISNSNWLLVDSING